MFVLKTLLNPPTYILTINSGNIMTVFIETLLIKPRFTILMSHNLFKAISITLKNIRNKMRKVGKQFAGNCKCYIY